MSASRSAALAVAALACQALFADKISVSQDRVDALYSSGETAAFTVSVSGDDGKLLSSGTAKWTLDNFGSKSIASGSADLSQGNPFTVKGSMSEPGFLRLIVKSSTNSVTWGVGYDVTKIRQDEPRPADFDEYWTSEKARLAREVPLDAKMTPDEKLSTKDAEVFRVNFATFGGKRVYGFLAVPRDKSAAPFPLLVEVPGAGPGAVKPWTVRKDAITLVMNVHMFEPAATGEEQRRLMQEANAALSEKFGFKKPVYCGVIGIGVSRESFHYHDVMLGINRAVDWAAELDGVDKTRVVYSGSSQGGAFGLFLNYLNPRFTKAFIAVAACTGHYASHQRRANGWPQIVASQPNAESKANAEKFARYFDGVNFAAAIRHPVRFLVGFADTTCPPPDVYAAFNACPAKDKEMLNCIGSGHSWAATYSKNRKELGWPDYKEWLLSK